MDINKRTDSFGFENFTCVICGEKIEGEWSNNAWPVKRGRCCSACNYFEVIPARLLLLEKNRSR